MPPLDRLYLTLMSQSLNMITVLSKVKVSKQDTWNKFQIFGFKLQFNLKGYLGTKPKEFQIRRNSLKTFGSLKRIQVRELIVEDYILTQFILICRRVFLILGRTED